MSADHYVYGLFRPDTGLIFYVGMGKRSRLRMTLYYGNEPKLAICKEHGAECVVVKDGLTREDAHDLERALILAIGREPHGPLVNRTTGGGSSYEMSEAARAKMSAAKLGKTSPRKGAVLTAETKARCRESALRRGAAQTECAKGHPYTEGNFRVRANGQRRCLICAREYEASHPRPSGWERQRQSSVGE